jgi:hypothetical protein
MNQHCNQTTGGGAKIGPHVGHQNIRHTMHQRLSRHEPGDPLHITPCNDSRSKKKLQWSLSHSRHTHDPTLFDDVCLLDIPCNQC